MKQINKLKAGYNEWRMRKLERTPDIKKMDACHHAIEIVYLICDHFHVDPKKSLLLKDLVAFEERRLPDAKRQGVLEVILNSNANLKVYNTMLALGEIPISHRVLYSHPEGYNNIAHWVKKL